MNHISSALTACQIDNTLSRPSEQLPVHGAHHLLHPMAKLIKSRLPVHQFVLFSEKLVVYLSHLHLLLILDLLFLQLEVIHFGYLGLTLGTENFCHFYFLVFAFLKSVSDSRVLPGNVLDCAEVV